MILLGELLRDLYLSQSKKAEKKVSDNVWIKSKLRSFKLPLFYKHCTRWFLLWVFAYGETHLVCHSLVPRDILKRKCAQRPITQMGHRFRISTFRRTFHRKGGVGIKKNFFIYLIDHAWLLIEKDTREIWPNARAVTHTPEFLFCSIRVGNSHTRTRGERRERKKKRGIPELWWAHP